MTEEQWDKKLKIHTTGRLDGHADQYRYPYEPTPYVVLESLANSGRIRKKDVFLLATDGIWRALTEEEWGQILGKKKSLNGKKAEKILH